MVRHDSQAYFRRLSIRAFSCAAMSAPILMTGFGCSEESRSGTVLAIESESPRSSIPPATRALAVRDVGAILDRYSAGAHDEAIHMLLRLAQSDAAPVRYRPFYLTEKEFIALPQAERDALSKKMLATAKTMRQLARELTRRALEASESGKSAESAEFLMAAKRLGSANRGPEVTLLIGLVGKAIETLADKRLAELDPHTSQSPG